MAAGDVFARGSVLPAKGAKWNPEIEMSAQAKVPPSARPCPFCGLATDVPHESQEGCIAALQQEIGRVRGILSTLKPAGVPDARDEEDRAASIRLSSTGHEII